MSLDKGKITQQNCDAVALFITTVQELRKSIFFSEEYQNLSLHMRGNDLSTIKVYLPDDLVLKATLLPFRRIWMNREPCHFLRVAAIIKRHSPALRVVVDSYTWKQCNSYFRKKPPLADIALEPDDVINVWLNTQFMHSGKSKLAGQFTLEDFNSLQKKIGSAIFKYYFVVMLNEIATSFFNLASCAKLFLAEWERQGVVPQIEYLGAPHDDSIVHHTPGYTPGLDTPLQRVWRLRRRRRYSSLARFLDFVVCEDGRVSHAAMNSEAFDQFLVSIGVSLTFSIDPDTASNDGFSSFITACDEDSTAKRRGECRSGILTRCRNGLLIWSGAYLQILEDQYSEFRNALLAEPFV